MKINLLLYGSLRDAMGLSNIEVNEISDTDSLKIKMQGQFPALSNHKFSVAVNQQIVVGNTVLQQGDIVAFLPPFAGG